MPEIVVTRLALRRHLVLRHACDLLPQYIYWNGIRS